VQLLSQRQPQRGQVNQVIDSIEAVRNNILQAPQKLADKAKSSTRKTTSTIAEYLRNTNLEELNPEGIQRDLTKLLDDPKRGWCTTRPTFSGGSGNLSQTAQSAEDLSEEQVNQIIDQVQEAIRALSKRSRRLAKRD